METIKMKGGEVLVCDPGYIKGVWCYWGEEKEPRFDALKLEKVLHDGDDGYFMVSVGDKAVELGVDSGRIWAMRAEFDVEVDIDAGLSGYWVGEAETESIEKVYEGE